MESRPIQVGSPEVAVASTTPHPGPAVPRRDEGALQRPAYGVETARTAPDRWRPGLGPGAGPGQIRGSSPRTIQLAASRLTPAVAGWDISGESAAMEVDRDRPHSGRGSLRLGRQSGAGHRPSASRFRPDGRSSLTIRALASDPTEPTPGSGSGSTASRAVAPMPRQLGRPAQKETGPSRSSGPRRSPTAGSTRPGSGSSCSAPGRVWVDDVLGRRRRPERVGAAQRPTRPDRRALGLPRAALTPTSPDWAGRTGPVTVSIGSSAVDPRRPIGRDPGPATPLPRPSARPSGCGKIGPRRRWDRVKAARQSVSQSVGTPKAGRAHGSSPAFEGLHGGGIGCSLLATRCGFSKEPMELAIRHIADLEFRKIDLALHEGENHLRPSPGGREPRTPRWGRLRAAPSLTPSAYGVDFGDAEGLVYRKRFEAICRLAKIADRGRRGRSPPRRSETPFDDEVKRLGALAGHASPRGGWSWPLMTDAINPHLRTPRRPQRSAGPLPGLGLTLDPSHYIQGPLAGGNYDEVLSLRPERLAPRHRPQARRVPGPRRPGRDRVRPDRQPP